MKFDFQTYISPFTMRYGSEQMRRVFSERHKFELWRKIWVALATVEYQAGLVSKKELEDLQKNDTTIDIERILEIEKETRHDVVAAIKEFAEKAKIGERKIHLGATSMDIVDNADMLRIKEALQIIEEKLKNLLLLFSEKIEKYASFPCLGYTHLQPAEPTTVGYRLAFYAQDLLISLNFLKFLKKNLKGKGFKGAVGTSASYQALLKGKKMNAEMLEEEIMKNLGIEAALITTQIYPRIFDYLVLSFLASLSSSIAKFAADIRLLQQPSIGEWSEPFAEKQIGSSAMPFKKNPISAENICSLARYVAALPEVTLSNISHSYLERTLDDSANKRIIMAEAFITTEQILQTAEKLILGLVIHEKRIAYNLTQYAPFSATEAVLMETVKRGANRQEMHEILRGLSMTAWQTVQEGKINPMLNLLETNPLIKKYLRRDEIMNFMDVKNYIGNAPERALKLVKLIKKMYEK